MTKKMPAPIPPGEILLEEFMKPNGISQNRLARDIDVNPARVNDIVHGRSAITAPVALRLAKYFNTTPELWMNLQAGYELRKARTTEWPRIEKRVRVMAAE
ncbi:MAG: HigA family addiction module antidote protein [Pseudorhodoplanes sp.]|nr:HigA family addiction module antidote protein [Pseudorhodoplanes sp.]